MLIPTVEQGLERLVRESLPLPEELGDVSFDAPSGSWGAALSRVTVNLFLYEVSRSAQPPRPAAQRMGPDGPERRAPLPMVQLDYLVSAWAGNVRDEHALLGDVLSCFLLHQILPAQHFDRETESSVQLAVGRPDATRPKDIWGGIDGKLRPSFPLTVTLALDTLGWEPLAPRVERIEALTAPVPTVPEQERGRRSDSDARDFDVRREGARLVTTPRTGPATDRAGDDGDGTAS